MRKIITISREFGAGGRSIGREVASKLGIAFYDRDIILKTAQETTDLTPEEIMKFEEKTHINVGFTQSLFDYYSRPIDEKIWDAQVKAIRHLADKESCVIVGRNADYILREFDHLLRVFVYADKQWRVQHLKTLMDDSESEIESKMNQADKARKNYCSKLTGRAYGDIHNYDLSINTGKFGFDKAVELILNTAENV
ncbi:MAG: cytidylate kinase-like family protein [Lachnospiraceae bacterium]|nr:cytidylate kinase-like family protein [Lachnospiraceae bacterium]